VGYVVVEIGNLCGLGLGSGPGWPGGAGGRYNTL